MINETVFGIRAIHMGQCIFVCSNTTLFSNMDSTSIRPKDETTILSKEKNKRASRNGNNKKSFLAQINAKNEAPNRHLLQSINYQFGFLRITMNSCRVRIRVYAESRIYARPVAEQTRTIAVNIEHYAASLLHSIGAPETSSIWSTSQAKKPT